MLGKALASEGGCAEDGDGDGDDDASGWDDGVVVAEGPFGTNSPTVRMTAETCIKSRRQTIYSLLP